MEWAGRWLAGRAGLANSDELEQRVEAVEARVDGLEQRLRILASDQGDGPSKDRSRGSDDRR